MQLNSIVFAAPKCSYSSQSLFKDIIYVPRCKEQWGAKDSPATPTEAASAEPSLYDAPIEPASRVCLPMSAGDLGSVSYQAQATQKFTYISDSPRNEGTSKSKGSIPCLFLDRSMGKGDRDSMWNSKQVNQDDVTSLHSGRNHSSFSSNSLHSYNSHNDIL